MTATKTFTERKTEILALITSEIEALHDGLYDSLDLDTWKSAEMIRYEFKLLAGGGGVGYHYRLAHRIIYYENILAERAQTA